MSLSPMDVYWIVQFDSIRMVAFNMCPILLILGIFSTVSLVASSCDSDVPKIVKVFGRLGLSLCFIGCVATLIIGMFLPSTKSACAIYVIPKIVNNESIQEDLGEVYTLGIDKLKEVLKDDSE